MGKSIIILIIAAILCASQSWGRMNVAMMSGAPEAAAPSATLKDSYSAIASPEYYDIGKYAAQLYVGGRFTTTSAYTLSSLRVSLQRTGTATGTLTAHIYATTGSPAQPTGSPLASSTTVDRSTVPTSWALVEFTGFSLALSNATNYAIIISANSVNGDETITIRRNVPGEYAQYCYTDADGTPAFSVEFGHYLVFETWGI